MSMSEFLKYPGESSNDSLSPKDKAVAHTRRVFLFKLAVGLNALVGAVLAVPLVGYLLGPTMKKSNVGSWITIGDVNDFPVGQTRLAEYRSPVATFDDGQTAKVPCWVRRISAQTFQVFAINCAHLGCPVRWFPQSKLFLCPCHGGAYYEEGARL
jgi:Rieske Fe-S protein